MNEYDLAIYESPRAGEDPVFEVIELHGSSYGGTMLVYVGRSYDGALLVLRTRYPDAVGVAANGGGQQPGRWYFNCPRKPPSGVTKGQLCQVDLVEEVFCRLERDTGHSFNRTGIMAALLREIAALNVRIEALEKADFPVTERGFGS